jgi:hypothetical protein
VQQIPNEDSIESTTAFVVSRFASLCASQIKAALDEALRDIDALSFAVLDTARHAQALLPVVDELGQDAGRISDAIAANSAALQRAVENSSTRLQFADRLSQRLSNVSTNLVGLADLMQSSNLPITDTQRSDLLERTRATFTMEQERQMFDALFASPTAAADAAAQIDASPDPVLFRGDNSDGT